MLDIGSPIMDSRTAASINVPAPAAPGRLRSRRSPRRATDPHTISLVGLARHSALVMERDAIACGVRQLRSHASPDFLLDVAEATRGPVRVRAGADVAAALNALPAKARGLSFTSPNDAA